VENKPTNQYFPEEKFQTITPHIHDVSSYRHSVLTAYEENYVASPIRETSSSPMEFHYSDQNDGLSHSLVAPAAPSKPLGFMTHNYSQRFVAHHRSWSFIVIVQDAVASEADRDQYNLSANV
jgi:hypothetical protein